MNKTKEVFLGDKYNKSLKFLRRVSDNEESKIALLKGDLDPIKIKYTFDNKLMIMPYNCPRICEGEFISARLSKVKKIHYDKENNNYLIEFE